MSHYVEDTYARSSAYEAGQIADEAARNAAEARRGLDLLTRALQELANDLRHTRGLLTTLETRLAQHLAQPEHQGPF
jgi:hypothetical protein